MKEYYRPEIKEQLIETGGEANDDLLERISALIHEEWMSWAKDVMDRKDELPERFEKWEKEMVPYEELSEDAKEYDREWGRKFIELIQSNNTEPKIDEKTESVKVYGAPYNYIANVTCPTSDLGHETFNVRFTSNFLLDKTGEERDKVIDKLAAEIKHCGFDSYKLNSLKFTRKEKNV